MIKIVCFAPGPKFKGGISNYNTSLAKALHRIEGNEVTIISWSNQYPSIFPRDTVDRSSKEDLLKGTDIKVYYLTDYNKPRTWTQTVSFIKDLSPDKVIIQWSVSIQGIPIGYMVKRLSKIKSIEVILDLHFVKQKEASLIDAPLTKYGIKHADTYITHAYNTVDELREVIPQQDITVTESGERSTQTKTVIKLYHPIYDLFEIKENFDVDAFKEQHQLKEHVFLFFGFIRKYKGLHYAIEAFNQLRQERDDISFLICGESFWNTLDDQKLSTKVKSALFSVATFFLRRSSSDEKGYQPLEKLKGMDMGDSVMVVNEFIPNEDVHKYFQVSDAVLLFYEFATPSGIESLSYNFRKPILATNVGHFPETIQDGINGYLADAEDVDSMAAQMRRIIDHPIDSTKFAESIASMSWDNYAKAIMHS